MPSKSTLQIGDRLYTVGGTPRLSPLHSPFLPRGIRYWLARRPPLPSTIRTRLWRQGPSSSLPAQLDIPFPLDVIEHEAKRTGEVDGMLSAPKSPQTGRSARSNNGITQPTSDEVSSPHTPRTPPGQRDHDEWTDELLDKPAEDTIDEDTAPSSSSRSVRDKFDEDELFDDELDQEEEDDGGWLGSAAFFIPNSANYAPLQQVGPAGLISSQSLAQSEASPFRNSNAAEYAPIQRRDIYDEAR